MRLLEYLTRLPVILFTGLSMIIIGAGFGYFQQFIGGSWLDMSLTGQAAMQRVSEMSTSEKQVHTWITLTLDSLYPIAYGSFFAGATLKLAGNGNRLWALPAFITMIADYCENAVQILGLNGFENFLLAKTLLTPLKYAALFATFIIFLVAGISALVRLLRRQRP